MDYEKRIDELEYILAGVMHSVDKWLEGDEFEQDEVNRAATMREKVLRIIEGKDARIQELDKKLQQAYSVIGEVVDKPNPFQDERKKIFDRRTALRILQDVSNNMRPSHNLFGTETLVITRVDFEKIRHEYLDKKE